MRGTDRRPARYARRFGGIAAAAISLLATACSSGSHSTVSPAQSRAQASASAQAHAAGLVAVFTVGKPENARDVLDRIHFPGTGLVDDGTLIHRYHISAVPLTFVLGRDGHVRDVYEGEQEQATFDDALAGL